MFRSCDRKVKFYPTHRNSFGLLPGPCEKSGTCPGCTRGAGGCYADENGAPVCYAATICRIYKFAEDKLRLNTESVKDSTCEEMKKTLGDMLSEFRKEVTEYAKKKKKDPSEYMYFRWHWSGDMFSRDYAEAVSDAIRNSPDVTHWIYTRTFDDPDVLDVFDGLENVTVFLSLDPCNWKTGIRKYFEHGFNGNLKRKLCFMAKSMSEVRDMVSEIMSNPSEYGNADEVKDWTESVTISTCPVDDGKMELEYGCSKCRKCIDGKATLVFFRT